MKRRRFPEDSWRSNDRRLHDATLDAGAVCPINIRCRNEF